MNKVMVITYTWPPKGGVGVMRVLKFAKYLPRFGWTPTIITTDESAPGASYRNEDIDIDLNSYNVIKTAYRKIFNFFPDRLRNLILMPDIHVGWYKFALKAAIQLLKRQKFDLIFSTSPPHTCQMIAKSIKRTVGLPWVADLRDLWSQCHFEKENFFRRRLSMAMERDILKDADALITVSRTWANDLLRTIRVVPSKLHVVTNGFDAEDFKDLPLRHPEKFTLVYTGKLDRRMQNPGIIFKAIAECIKDGLMDKNKIEMKFYILGFKKADVKKLAYRYSLAEVLTVIQDASYKESLVAQRSSTLLLFFQWKTAKGWYSTKIFEYLGSRKPILVISEKDSIVNTLMRNLNAGFIANSYSDLKNILSRCYKEYLKNGFINSNIDEEQIKSYTRFETARSLVNIFNRLTEQQHS